MFFKDKLLPLTPAFITNDRNKNVQMKKTHTRLLAAAVFLLLLIPQGVWMVSAVRQGKEERKAKFQDRFNQAISFYIYESKSADPSITQEETIKKVIAQAAGTIDLVIINSHEDIGRMLENAILLLQIESGKITMNDLGAVIQNYAKDLGDIISARLSLYNAYNEKIDNVSLASNLTKRLFVDTYTVERSMENAEQQYIIRAEYQIAPQGYLVRARNPIIVSGLVSVIIGIALFSRNSRLQWWNDKSREQHPFDAVTHSSPPSPVYPSLCVNQIEESIAGTEHIQAGNIVLNLRNQALICENDKIKDLRPMEYAVLKKLIDNFGQTVTRKELMVTIWGDQEENYSEPSMNNCIYRVRSLLKNDTNLDIRVIKKVGYKLVIGE